MGYPGMMTEEEQAEEVSMMGTPQSWPCWPVLPLKRREDEGPTEGFLYCFDFDAPKPTIYLANMYDPSIRDKTVKEIPSKEYTSFDEIVKDGWIVD